MEYNVDFVRVQNKFLLAVFSGGTIRGIAWPILWQNWMGIKPASWSSSYTTLCMLQVELKFKLIIISTKVDFFSLGQIFST